MSPQVVVIVAPNGVGHLRRVVGVLHTLISRRPDLDVHVVCQQWQTCRLESWDRARALRAAGVTNVEGYMEPGVHWALDPSVYADGRLLAWEARLSELAVLRDADLVVSDNLVGVLGSRPDAVLMGSFLWADVLRAAHPHDPHVAAFVERDRELLSRHRPPMLCVGDVAMPGVMAGTDAVALAWMCESPPLRRPALGRRVAVLGGRTGIVDELLGRVAQALAQRGFEVTVPDGAAVLGLQPFRFTATEFAAADVVVCRPGIGTVTDCVGQRTPMVVLREHGNVEMAHNAGRLAALGVASDVGAEPSVDTVVEAVASVVAQDEGRTRGEAMQDRMAELESDGLHRAAEWLANRMGRSMSIYERVGRHSEEAS